MTNREQYIKDTFFSKLPEEEAIEIVKKISEIGDSIGFIGANVSQDNTKSEKRKHKYDVWISKEVSKNREILKKSLELRLIIDWATETNADIFQYDFEDAFQEQEDWHEDMKRKYQIEKMNIPDIDEKRVVFRFSDKKHFLYLLTPGDLKVEGTVMGHCVGGAGYKSKVKNKQSLILSIRDEKNMPHVTIEVDVKARRTVQKYGKGNKPPVRKYLEMYAEYVYFATDFKDLKDREVLKFLNLDFGLKKL